MTLNLSRFKYLSLLFDFLVLTTAFVLSLHFSIYNLWDFKKYSAYYYVSHIFLGVLFVCTYLFVFRLNSLYKRNVLLSRYRQFILIIKSLIVAGCAICAFMILSNVDYFTLYGRQVVGSFSMMVFAMLFLGRVFFTKTVLVQLARRNIYQTKVLVLGGDAAGIKAANALSRDSLSDFHVAGFLDDYKEVGARINGKYNNLGRLDDLDNIVARLQVDELLIAIDNAPYDRLIQVVERCLQTGKHVKIYSDLLDVVAKKMDVELYATIPVVVLNQYPLADRTWLVKRVLDIVISLIAIVALTPLFAVVVAGIKLSSRGPVIFKQQRMGLHGKPFNFYKFRSMHVANDDTRHKEFVQDLIKGDRKQCGKMQVLKITDDPRIFWFGKLIRKTSLDEFPQLFNVLKGEMSLVGPRPCLPYEWECYEKWHKKRLNITPGCTGLWQALGRSAVSFEEMVILDLYYKSNMSLWLDFKIMLQTIPVIFFGKGAY